MFKTTLKDLSKAQIFLFLFSIVNTKCGRKTEYFPARFLNRLKFSTKWFSLRNNWFKNIILIFVYWWCMEKNTSRGKYRGVERTPATSKENQYFCYNSALSQLWNQSISRVKTIFNKNPLNFIFNFALLLGTAFDEEIFIIRILRRKFCSARGNGCSLVA